MELVLQVTGLCMVGALLVLVVKRGSPETALLLTLAAAVTVLLLLLAGAMEDLVAFLRELGEASGISEDLFVPLYKTVGIALVVKVGGSLCKDAGESALGSVVEMAGTVCALLVALPLLRAVLLLLRELMQ